MKKIKIDVPIKPEENEAPSTYIIAQLAEICDYT